WKDPPTRYARSHRQIAYRLRPERNELAAKIASENMRKLPLVRLVAPRARHQVVAVETDSMDFDQRFTPFGRRHPEVGIFENVGVAILLKNYRLHLLRDQFHLHGISQRGLAEPDLLSSALHRGDDHFACSGVTMHEWRNVDYRHRRVRISDAIAIRGKIVTRFVRHN